MCIGEGFEDTVAALLRRIPGVADTHEVPGPAVAARPARLPATPRRQQEAPGRPRPGPPRHRAAHAGVVQVERAQRPGRTVRQRLRDYAELEDAGQDFGYALVTNEFDPARLAAACDMRRQNAPLFIDVVHVNTDGPRAAYAAAARSSRRADTGGVARALGHVDSGRLASLDGWAAALAAQ